VRIYRLPHMSALAAGEAAIAVQSIRSSGAVAVHLWPCIMWPHPLSPCLAPSAASEHTVLACLWLLESVESVWRSPATVCLNDYLKHLAVFSPEAVVAITADWKRSFRELREGVVAAQSDLLQRLGWLLRLDLVSGVWLGRVGWLCLCQVAWCVAWCVCTSATGCHLACVRVCNVQW
jgi:hypothetical protein